MKYLLIILMPSMVYAQAEIADAKKSVMSLIRPLMADSSAKRPAGTEKFRVDGCEKHKVDWMGLLLQQKTATINFKFKEGCDLEGTIVPKVLQPFPINLNLRNIQSYSKIETINKVTAILEIEPILNLEMRQGFLSGKTSKVKFEADYQVQVSPIDNKVVRKNLGGEIRISEINGKKVTIKEKILVD